jgi:hypothetical protein
VANIIIKLHENQETQTVKYTPQTTYFREHYVLSVSFHFRAKNRISENSK